MANDWEEGFKRYLRSTGQPWYGWDLLIELAEAGNLDAGRALWRDSEELLQAGQTLPRSILEWRRERLNAAFDAPERAGQEMRVAHRRRHPPQHAYLDRFTAASDEHMKFLAAIWVAEEHAAGAPIRSTKGSTRTAPAIIAERLGTFWKHVGEGTVRRWYDEHRREAIAHIHERDVLRGWPDDGSIEGHIGAHIRSLDAKFVQNVSPSRRPGSDP